jgi:hypothetical protein
MSSIHPSWMNTADLTYSNCSIGKPADTQHLGRFGMVRQGPLSALKKGCHNQYSRIMFQALHELKCLHYAGSPGHGTVPGKYLHGPLVNAGCDSLGKLNTSRGVKRDLRDLPKEHCRFRQPSCIKFHACNRQGQCVWGMGMDDCPAFQISGINGKMHPNLA